MRNQLNLISISFIYYQLIKPSIIINERVPMNLYEEDILYITLFRVIEK